MKNSQPDLFNQPSLPPRKQPYFYDTIPSTVEDSVKAKTQEDKIVAFFKEGREGGYTSVEVSDALSINLNSARRCMTNLCKLEYPVLVKTDKLVQERFSKMNHVYKLR